jgi:hypothetical protein
VVSFCYPVVGVGDGYASAMPQGCEGNARAIAITTTFTLTFT